MIELAIEAAASSASVAIAIGFALRRARRRRPALVERQSQADRDVDRSCSDFARGLIDVDELELQLEYALGLRERPEWAAPNWPIALHAWPAPEELDFAPGARWPVDGPQAVRLFPAAISATSWTASSIPMLVRRPRQPRQLSLEDEYFLRDKAVAP